MPDKEGRSGCSRRPMRLEQARLLRRIQAAVVLRNKNLLRWQINNVDGDVDRSRH